MCFADSLVEQFNFERLEFDFFRERVVLAVVFHIVELAFIARDCSLCFIDFVFLGLNVLVERYDVVVVFLQTRGQTLNLVFKVAYFQRKFAAKRFDFVNF